MTHTEIVQKNIALTFDFIRYIIQHPDLFEMLPDQADIEFIATDLPFYGDETAFIEEEHKPMFFKVEHAFSLMA
jgi:hypothetical protein